ncbi:ankyrin repeat-containing protein [Toxoplasma gondii RUB]|uniref:Ankyrin repeat-containing protein n=9 Tax=Toxoplasma gondii TaxID=5811 RepID=A0A125YPT2_TOXGV|nr:ankyrin repeat-containing protein [Toxoplasma gondii GT1]ESS30449.1 ankyrin repeat-containing protein [Toxoplasma gondii VEG]KAF4645262.1 ankyrin repeat-containing protein [Toxoplasma gondii]KFG35382.1 ankyrin repeat-containing protein [Toxoplasma gondii GAB2-2007-GAL-DOM2]KFG46670.1 ankyrin repeat-containing protein [Toxoplasma gondii p89]KFG53059.1 ankyrin repeat-containing protein [Toxoplasma gondii FOU]KFG59917.1 ankyrin repeat-containing protein [Toxoplasma gondii RUB]KFH06762.1 anky
MSQHGSRQLIASIIHLHGNTTVALLFCSRNAGFSKNMIHTLRASRVSDREGEVQDRLIRNCVQPQHSDAESASVCDLLLRHCRSTSEHDVQTSERSDGPARIPMSHFAVWQALRCSCLQGKKRTFETLCALGVDVQAADAAAQQQQKGSLVHAAAVGGSQSIIQRLLDDYHLSPEGLTTNSNHNEPVHLAAAHGRTHALLQLINRGVSIDTRDRHGRTPLFHAAVNGHLSTVKALTESGARIQVTDYDGISLIEEATRRARIRDGQGRQALAEYLQHMLQQRKEEDGACS